MSFKNQWSLSRNMVALQECLAGLIFQKNSNDGSIGSHFTEVLV